jgi:predicted ribosomally synthesized peptide with SipW-like signal peptide
MRLFTLKRVVVALLALSALAGMLTGGTHALFTDSTANTGNSVETAELTAPSLSQPTASGASVPLTWTAATLPGNGSLENQISYSVERKLGSGSFGPAGAACTDISTTSCTDTVSTGGTYTYRVVAEFRSWTATSNERTVTVALGGPAAPTTVALANGGGVGNAYINDANKGSVNVTVGLPASSVSTDTIHVTITDGTNTTTDKTAAATNGAGNVTVTGIDAAGLTDGSVTIRAHVSNASGNSSQTTTSVTKDTVKPSSTAGTVANITSPNSTFVVPYTTGETGTSLDEVRLYVDGPGAGTNYAHEETDGDPSQTGESFSYDGATSNGTYSFYTRALDNAGNLEDAPATPPDSSASRAAATAPNVTAAVIAKSEGRPNSTPGWIRNQGAYYVYANVTAGTGSIASVTANTSSIGPASTPLSVCSADCTVGGVTYGYVSNEVTANNSLSNPRGFAVTATDSDGLSDTMGNTTTSSSLTVQVDNTAPTTPPGNRNAIFTTNVTPGGTAGRPEPGDRVTFIYSEPIEPNSLLGSWAFPWSAATTDVRVTIDDISAAEDRIVVTTADGSTTLPFGTLSFNDGDYVSGGDAVFGGDGAAQPSTLTRSGSSFVLTLGSRNGGAGTVGTDTGNQLLTWDPNVNPATAVYDRAGNRITDSTDRTGNGTQF